MTPDDPDLEIGSLAAAFRNTLGKVGADKAQRVINVLLESPFFYRDDDLDLFGLLRRRQSLFQEFFEVFFGWELYIDQQVARLIKPKTFNPQLKPSQRHVFRITGRHQYVLFILLLEFYQNQADEQNVDLESEAEIRFVLGDFVEFAFRRYREELGDGMPEEAIVLGEMRSLFRKLEQHRFVALTETAGIVTEEGLTEGFTREGASSVLYAMLPGLRCYRPEELSRLDVLGRIEVSGSGDRPGENSEPAVNLDSDSEEREADEAEEVEL